MQCNKGFKSGMSKVLMKQRRTIYFQMIGRCLYSSVFSVLILAVNYLLYMYCNDKKITNKNSNRKLVESTISLLLHPLHQPNYKVKSDKKSAKKFLFFFWNMSFYPLMLISNLAPRVVLAQNIIRTLQFLLQLYFTFEIYLCVCNL